MSAVMTFQNVSYWYEDKKSILNKLNISFEQGKFYSIVGASGSGKTTFLSLAAGLDDTKEGQIFYQDQDLKKIGLSKYRNQCVSIIFQGYNLLTYMTALQNVVTAMEIKKIKAKHKKEIALKMLARVGLDEEQANKKVLHLSGGQQQRVAIARALVSDANLIIADEPTGNLDEETSQEIMMLMKDIVKQEQKTLIMVTHNKELAEQTDEVYEVKKRQLNRIK